MGSATSALSEWWWYDNGSRVYSEQEKKYFNVKYANIDPEFCTIAKLDCTPAKAYNNDVQFERFLKYKLNINGMEEMGKLINNIYVAEKENTIVINYNHLEYTKLTEKTFEARIDGLITLLSTYQGNIIANVVNGLKALKVLGFRNVKKYAFVIVLNEGDEYRLIAFNFNCTKEASVLDIPLLHIGSVKTNYAQFLVYFKA
jgi:hypothetical protein